MAGAKKVKLEDFAPEKYIKMTPEIKNLLRGLRAMTKWGLGPSGGGGTVDDWSSGRREAEERMRKEIRRLLKEFNSGDSQK